MAKKRSERERQATAYHEAGHAAVALHLGRKVLSVDIIHVEEKRQLGVCHNGRTPRWFQPEFVADGRTRLLLEKEIMVFLAGHLAERRFTGRRNYVGASRDHSCAADLADYACGSAEQVEAFLAWLEVRTDDTLRMPLVWRVVEAIAAALMEREHLTGRQVRAILQGVEDAAFALPREFLTVLQEAEKESDGQ
jgi:ATP-dependent Zn protease